MSLFLQWHGELDVPMKINESGGASTTGVEGIPGLLPVFASVLLPGNSSVPLALISFDLTSFSELLFAWSLRDKPLCMPDLDLMTIYRKKVK